MILQLCLLHFIFSLLIIPSSFSAGLIPKPECPDRCGNLSIPFPFGVGSDCSYGEFFNITCNTSTNTPTPYLSYFDDIKIVEINPSQIRVSFKNLLNAACYNESGESIGNFSSAGHTFHGSPYIFSDENWLTAIGCGDLLTAFSIDDEVDEVTFGGSCATMCMNVNGSGFCPANDSGHPPGNGCCLIPSPKGMVLLSTRLTNLAEATWRDGNKKLFPCSYVFLQEKVSPSQSRFSYPLSYLNNSNEFLEDGLTLKTRVPSIVRLDWRINGAKNCSQAQKNVTSYACGDHSDCVNYNARVGGYLCRCKQGYQGNPYLTAGDGGCQDINECDHDNPCDPHSHCKNIPGSFNCTCLRGYTGDGMKNGKGCTRSPFNMNKMVSIGLGSALGLLLLLLLYLWLRKVLEKRNNKKRKEDLFKHLLLLQQQTSEATFGKTKLFTAKELDKATDHFNESRICGRGGQGIVYKGMLSDGTIVAIKKLKEVDENHVEQFINEVVILSQINHKNVVRLLGCCLATEGPQLVYEFLPNGTLFNFIHGPKVEFPLTWNTRLKIAADVAGALTYLHFASSIPIYHRDIKSTNILLDEKYVVKVSDFGMSKLVQVDQTHLTTMVKGTFGYLDPEYYQTSQYTEKSDVYSFGVVLVELLTGQRPISLEMSEVGRNLAGNFLAYMEANNLDAILDTQVSEEGAKEEVIAVARLARRCLNVKGNMRPTMKEVATELESLMMSQIPSTVDDEPKDEITVSEAKHMTFSDIEYTWTISDHSMVTESSDAHP